MKFTTTIHQDPGRSTTGLVLSAEQVEALGQGKKPPVKVTINGYTYRSTVASMGGRFMIAVSSEVREKAGVSGGDTVEVELELDTEPRTVEEPADLKAALDADPVARAAFDKLSNSHKKQHTLAIEGAKAAETRARRVEKTIAILRGEA